MVWRRGFGTPRARCSFLSPSPLGGRGEGEGGPLAPPRASGCVLPLPSTPLARCVPPLPSTPLALRSGRRLDPLPRRGRGIRKRGCAMRLPAAMQRPGAREGLRGPARGARRTAALLVLEAAPQATVDRGCHSERSLRSEESTRSDLPAASAQAGQRERNATAKAVSIPAAMQWLVRAPPLSFPRARCSFLSPSPLGGRGRGEGGCWRHLEPLGASSLSLILSPGGGEESGKGDARRLSLRRCNGLAHAKDFGAPRARCAFFFPSPLGGRGKGEGGCWRHLEPLGASPLCLRLRLRSAQDGALILSPGGGEESGKGDARRVSLPPCNGHARG